MLGAIKLGAVIIPATTLLTTDDIADRLLRGDVRHVVAASSETPKFASLAGTYTRICVGAGASGWVSVDEARSAPAQFQAEGITRATDPLLLYFTSGTTSKPKLVLHTQQSYPVGHLTTMHWIGLRPGDVHWNIGAAQPEVIDRVRAAWGSRSATAMARPKRRASSATRPFSRSSPDRWAVRCRVTTSSCSMPPADEGEIALVLDPRSVGLMQGYADDPAKTGEVTRDGRYRTGDVASRDADGYITYVGRADDVFKASDYRISPFELESVLIEHDAVAEAAVVPSPDPLRLAVPKCFVALRAGHAPSRDLAVSILRHARDRLAPYRRIRRLEFADLPKTISGKIRRVDLRNMEAARAGDTRRDSEFWEEDLPELR